MRDFGVRQEGPRPRDPVLADVDDVGHCGQDARHRVTRGRPAGPAAVKAHSKSSTECAFLRRLHDCRAHGARAAEHPGWRCAGGRGAPGRRRRRAQQGRRRAVTGRSAVSYGYTTDTSSTLSEPLEADAAAARLGHPRRRGHARARQPERRRRRERDKARHARRAGAPCRLTHGCAMQLVESTTSASARESTLSYLTRARTRMKARTRKALNMGRGAARRWWTARVLNVNVSCWYRAWGRTRVRARSSFPYWTPMSLRAGLLVQCGRADGRARSTALPCLHRTPRYVDADSGSLDRSYPLLSAMCSRADLYHSPSIFSATLSCSIKPSSVSCVPALYQ